VSATATNKSFGQTSTTMNRPLYQKGDAGQEVALVQQYLAGVGFSPGAIDGKYGDNTVAAVVAFQQNVGLKADGVVWLETFNALSDAWSKSRPRARPQPIQSQPIQSQPIQPGEIAEHPSPLPKWVIFAGLAAAGAVALYYFTRGVGVGRPAMAGYSDECSCEPRHRVKSRRLRS
jgi:peptidoglycan hydrolase-like protein with peptidoglycan-binding domain